MLEVNLASRKPAIRSLAVPPSVPVTISLCPSEGRFAFRAKAKALGARSEIAGFAVDGPINSRRENGGLASLRLGPDEWLFVCPEEDADGIAQTIRNAMGDAPHSLVEVSHRDVSFEVCGRDAPFALNAGCPIDLSLGAFPVGSATRTVFGKADIVLARTGETIWRVTTWRSFANYVQGFIAEASQDFASD